MGKITAPIGGTYQSYASGSGSISFVHVDHNGKATGEKVPLHICDELKPEGYRLTHINGDIEAFKPVKRLNADMLEMDGQQFKYWKTEDTGSWRGYAFSFELDGAKIRLQNYSMLAALHFFLENEAHLTNAI